VITRVQPDLVIADLQMETQDAGLRLLARLRADPATAEIGLILCSADTRALEQRRAEVTKFAATVVPKPFELDELVSTVKQRLAGRREGP
jgi:CheY-like chemotaxis protein